MKLAKFCVLLASTLIMTSCGGTEVYYVYQSADGSMQPMPAGGAPMQAPIQQQAAPQSQAIMNDVAPAPAAAPVTSTKSSKTKTTKSTATSGTHLASQPAPTKPGAAPAAGGSVEDKLLTKARDAFAALQTMSATVNNFEKGNSGVEGTGQVKINFKKPSSLKIDVVSSSDTSQVGAKLAYSDPSTAKVRPAGGLSFVSISLPMTDNKLLSGRKYQLNQIDLAATVQRLTKSGTKAKLAGQTTVGGSKVVLLEITPVGHFDSRITKEVLGLDMATFMPRIHEMYEGGTKVYGVQVSTLSVNAPLSPDDLSV